MKIERVKNASRNMFFGIIQKTYQIIIPFVMRTAMIYFMGVQYLGLNGLCTSILQVLNLAELGVGSAMIYSMYKPIAEDNTKRICALLKLYKTYYTVIGAVIAVFGIILTPFIPNLISGDIPSGMNIYILYLLNLAATVLSYWMLAYKNSILQAHQRVDVISKVTMTTSTVQYVLQFLVLWLFKNYYLYVLVMLVTQVLTNIATAIVASKMYPDYKAEGKLNKAEVKEINARIRDLFTSKIGAVIVNSADTIVISAFLGLTMLAIYQNYYFILTAIIGFITIIFNSCTAGIGNSLIVETKEKNFNDLKKFTFLIAWISGFCSSCFLCLYQPFMKIWVGEELQLPFNVVICLVIYYFIYEINQLLNMYKDAGGIWHEDRFRPLVTAIANLGMNLIMVQFWGIYGIILSTVLSTLLVGMPWLFHNLFTTLFEKSQLSQYIKNLMFYVIISLITCILTYLICSKIVLGDWITIIVRGIICCIIPNTIFFLAYHKLSEFKGCLQLVDKMTREKFRLKRKFTR